MNVRDRIRELRRVRAGDLIPNPKNWRTHPAGQQDALRGVLAEVGYVDALLGRDTPAGVMLIDGHLRAETTPEMDVPVLILDVDEAEADKIMLTLDPLAGLSGSDAGKLDELLRSVETSSEAVAAMLEDLAGVMPFEFADPPESVQENADELEEIKRQRRDGNAETESKNDTEKYLVIVYASRAAKEADLQRLGLPSDERYVPASSLKIDCRAIVRRTPEKTNGRATKSAPAKKSGAGG